MPVSVHLLRCCFAEAASRATRRRHMQALPLSRLLRLMVSTIGLRATGAFRCAPWTCTARPIPSTHKRCTLCTTGMHYPHTASPLSTTIRAKKHHPIHATVLSFQPLLRERRHGKLSPVLQVPFHPGVQPTPGFQRKTIDYIHLYLGLGDMET